MTAPGFLNQKQRHPIALTAAIAINLSAVTALMLAKTDYVKKLPTVIWARHIPMPKPPEPIPTPKQPEIKAPRDQVFVPPQPPTGAIEERPKIGETDILPALPNNFGGSDPGPRVEPDTKPEPLPVMTDAAPLPGAARDFQPPYPAQLLRMSVEGKAVVRVLIGTDGWVKQVAIISADDPLFGDATERQALRKWRFKPAMRDGLPVESWKQLTVRFEIK